jgi:hypothetical protein
MGFSDERSPEDHRLDGVTEDSPKSSRNFSRIWKNGTYQETANPSSIPPGIQILRQTE